MTTISGVVRNGQVILDQPGHLPEGRRVEVVPVEASRPTLGMCEEDWPTTPEGIAALLTRMGELEPGWLTPEDDAAWRAALSEQKAFEKARFLQDADKLRDLWK